jgi:pectinesterase
VLLAAVPLAGLSAAVGAPAGPPAFTIDTVMAALKDTYPQARRVSEALPPGVETHEGIAYSRPGGIALALDIYRPADRRVLPAVLVVHGGGWIAGDRTMERPFARSLATRGYVAVPVSYRLGRPGRYPAPVLDLRAAVRWLRAHAGEYAIAPDRIAAVGGSAGGTLVASLGASNGEWIGPGDEAGPADVQAIVDIDGTVTFLDNRLIRKSEMSPSPYLEYMHGAYGDAPAAWVAASPITHVTRRSAPTLFIMSSTSQPILAGREEMAERLSILGIDAAIVRIPGTPHTFWLVHPWFERVVEETDRFLAAHLRGRP